MELEIVCVTTALTQIRSRDTAEEEMPGSSVCLLDTHKHTLTHTLFTLSLLLSRMSAAISSTAACHIQGECVKPVCVFVCVGETA